MDSGPREQQQMAYQAEYRARQDFERSQPEQPAFRFEQGSYERRYEGIREIEPPLAQQQGFMYAFPLNRPLTGESQIIGGVLCYALGWFSGLLFALFGWQNRYIRFHALQSLAFFGLINLLDVALFFSYLGLERMAHVFALHRIFALPFMFILFIINVIAFVGWLVGMIQAARGQYYKMPIVGKVIWGLVNNNPTLK
ncbi:hypothetical protein EPA93_42310 [Ktedonosporobacter rubrisoli]|uniref:DUF4870 domain-containing protein n=1 Tax=Ktedonosporobacter rubrisoli TaxID=2509675 RepID=A0A4P6K2W1_KTERU|nr:hypothetical protein [Ktedonosporobacter rubrisoli]QBD82262.1 hypothetical protein EPA93_42310 [Ktedonosporobacter rubrisoli]